MLEQLSFMEENQFVITLSNEDLEAREFIYEDFVNNNTHEVLLENEEYGEYELTVLKGVLGQILKKM